jgi:hypothetical protein
VKRCAFAIFVSVYSLLISSPLLPRADFPNSAVPLPSGWSGPVFKLSQDYPTQATSEAYPWLQIDPTTDPTNYMQAVLQYCLAGNVEVDWVVQNNQARHWYHAPWMHWGNHGREPIRGLTFERMSQAGELAQNQTSVFQNWAIGFYNSPGGFTLGRVWLNPLKPDSSAAVFPVGTVSFKLLFTEATPDQVPSLSGSLEWDAFIYTNGQNAVLGAPRVVKKLRLLQVDVAVRDSRVNGTSGWVFGTFIYDGNVVGDSPYAKLRPVGLMWGNDPTLGLKEYGEGTRAQETRLNPEAQPVMRHYGWLDRLNGPVDNPKSACLSCHATAQWPVAAPMVPPTNISEGSPQWMQWFRNIGPGQTFSSGTHSLDYSLQLASGIQNLTAWINTCRTTPSTSVVPPCPPAALLALNAHLQKPRIPLGYQVSRDGGEAQPGVRSPCGPRCGTERWSVKTLSDADATKVLRQRTVQTVHWLVSQIPPSTLPENNRISPIETTTFGVEAKLLGFKRESDLDIHMVLRDEHSMETMIAEIPNFKCDGVCASTAASLMRQAETTFVQHCGVPTTGLKKLTKPLLVRVTGVGFFDFKHGQTGVAKNAIELHPVLQIQFPDGSDDCARHVAASH